MAAPVSSSRWFGRLLGMVQNAKITKSRPAIRILGTAGRVQTDFGGTLGRKIGLSDGQNGSRSG